MEQLIDIHTHLAWNIDDGFPNAQDSEHMLEQMKRDGIQAIIATPHVVPGQMDKAFYSEVRERIYDLKDMASSFGIEVYEGCEVFLNHTYLDVFDNSLYFPLAGSDYVLVEFDVRKNMAENDEAEDMLYEITIRNKIPVIAHVERYFHDGIDLKRVKSWIDMGCYVQVNRTSLLGMHGAISQKNAEKLIQNNLAHIMASDAHRVKGSRVCKLSDAYGKLETTYGREVAQIMCFCNPMHIIHNEDLETIQTKKQSLFKSLWRKR